MRMARIFSALGTFKCHVQVSSLVLQYLPCGTSYSHQALGATLPFWQQQSFGFASCEMPDTAGDMTKLGRTGIMTDGALLGSCLDMCALAGRYLAYL